jgi:lysyl-tRNA synthetase class 2
MTAVSSWWDRASHADRRSLLVARGRIRDAVRRYFAERDFVEVECAALQVSPGNEAHLHAFSTERIGPDGAAKRLYLHT